jgi:hypothetical protein
MEAKSKKLSLNWEKTQEMSSFKAMDIVNNGPNKQKQEDCMKI